MIKIKRLNLKVEETGLTSTKLKYIHCTPDEIHAIIASSIDIDSKSNQHRIRISFRVRVSSRFQYRVHSEVSRKGVNRH